MSLLSFKKNLSKTTKHNFYFDKATMMTFLPNLPSCVTHLKSSYNAAKFENGLTEDVLGKKTGIISLTLLMFSNKTTKLPNVSLSMWQVQASTLSVTWSSLVSEHSDGMKQPESLGQSLSSSCWLWDDLSSASLTSSPAETQINKLHHRKLLPHTSKIKAVPRDAHGGGLLRLKCKELKLLVIFLIYYN